LQAARLDRATGTWTRPEHIVAVDSPDAAVHDFGFLDGGDVFVAVRDESQADSPDADAPVTTRFAYYSKATGHWGGPVTVPGGANGARLGHDSAGNVVAAWSDATTSGPARRVRDPRHLTEPLPAAAVWVARYVRAKGEWLPGEVLGAVANDPVWGPSRAIKPQVAVAPGGHATVTWLRASREAETVPEYATGSPVRLRLDIELADLP
jgi:hypothetical protein